MRVLWMAEKKSITVTHNGRAKKKFIQILLHFLPLLRQAIHWISRTLVTSCPIRKVNTRTGMCVLFSSQFQASNTSVWFAVTPSVTSIMAWLHCRPVLELLQPLSSRYWKITQVH